MNKALLNSNCQIYINKHLKSDLPTLIFKGSPFKNVTVKELVTQIEAKKKSTTKLPTWFKTAGIYFPNKLNIAQASSEIAAQYKSDIIGPGDTLIDLTGGLGVDTYYFAKRFKQVVHCEKNKELSLIADHNFKTLQQKNIEIVTEDGLQYLEKYENKIDWIYLDPSRRDRNDKKVFFLEQCTPKVEAHLDLLLLKSNRILIKLSPLLDIKKTLKDLKNVKEVHCVAVKNEMKELLFILEKNYTEAPKIVTINIIYSKLQKFVYQVDDLCNVKYNFIQKYIYEPNVSILKSGGYNHISNRFKLFKLHPNTHLFTSDILRDFPGRCFKVLELLKFDKKNIKSRFGNTKANIATRNFPLTVAEIRKKFKIKDGGTTYLFFITDNSNTYKIVVCKKV